MNIFNLLDRLPAYLERKRRFFLMLIATATCKFKCFIWKIEVGESPEFHGLTNFYRSAQSKIVIGNQCRFRSAFWSNYIGLNRPCSLATMKPGAEIIIGNHCGLSGTVISAAKSIRIGNNVLCGGNVTIVDTDFHGIEVNERNGASKAAQVVIEDNVWLGLNVTVLKGVHIGKGSVIAAGSTVTSSIPDNVIAGGTPAKILKNIG